MNISSSQEMDMFWVRRAWSCESCLYAASKGIQSKSLSWVGSTYHLCLPGSAPESWRYKPEPGTESRHLIWNVSILTAGPYNCPAVKHLNLNTLVCFFFFFFPLMVMNTFTILQDCVSPFPSFFLNLLLQAYFSSWILSSDFQLSLDHFREQLIQFSACCIFSIG